MGVLIFQESSISSEAETGLNVVTNVPLIKRKINMKKTKLFKRNIRYVILVCLIKFFVNMAYETKNYLR